VKREIHIVSRVYPVYSVCLVERDKPDEPVWSVSLGYPTGDGWV